MNIDDQRSERVPKPQFFDAIVMQGRDICRSGQVQKLLPDPIGIWHSHDSNLALKYICDTVTLQRVINYLPIPPKLGFRLKKNIFVFLTELISL